MEMLEKLSCAGTVPVIKVEDAADHVPLCKALADGGLPVAEITYGDADGNGKVNVKDATTVQKAVAGLITISEVATLTADTDGNGKMNVKDATAIQKWVAGMETDLLIGKEITA